MGGITGTLENIVQGLYKESPNPSHTLGTRWATADGRAYRYAKAGAAISIGRVVGPIAKEANLKSDNLVAATCARTTAQWDAGNHTVIVATTSSATTAYHIYPNRFDDGYLWVNDLAGEGQIMQIKSHGVSTSSGTTALTITMYDEELLTIALTTASQMGLGENLYKDVVTHTGREGTGGPAIGVASRAITSGYYFWLQTWGPCPVMTGPDTMVPGEPAVTGCSTGTSTGLAFVAGSIYPANTTMTASTISTGATRHFMQPEVGFVMTRASGDAEFSLVYLTMAP